MASLASLVNLGRANSVSLGNFDGSVSLVNRRLTFLGYSISSSRYWSGKRIKYVAVCSKSVTTNYVERENSLSCDSTNRGSSKDNDTDRFFTATPIPVLESGAEVDVVRNTLWGEAEVDKEDELSEVIQSLGEVLETAGNLKTSKKVNNVSVNNKHSPNGTAHRKYVRAAVNSVENSNLKSKTSKNRRTVVNVVEHSERKSKTMKNVWRKEHQVATMQKVVKKPKKQEPPVGPPQEIQPKLQSRPSVTPSSIQKPVTSELQSKPVCGSETGLALETKQRKTILIDKFASKKPVVDPLITKGVSAPPKPRTGLGHGPSKYKNDLRKKSSSSGEPRRRMVNNDDDDNGIERPRRGKKWTKASRRAVRLQAERAAAPVRVEIMEVCEDGMLTEELSQNLAVREGEILGYLYSKGIRPDGVQKLSKDVVKMICKEYEVEVIDTVPLRVEDGAKKKKILEEDDLDKLEDRPPVLTIMGHVDHGKTTLLDYIRKSKVAAGEAGGITQGIGAYKVQVPIDGKKQTCVFLDTPGHEAFGAMRARGARVTDIAVIVVAADDGIRPQTSEAIAHAKAAGVPIIVAINKIDVDGANPDRVIQDLSSIGLMPEEWGGDIPMVKISALKGENVDELLETIMLLAELQELKANPHRNAKGTVIEAGLDKSKGPVATFIVQNGTIRRGDILVCGEAFGKVRALFDDNGKRVDEAGPSIPVQVIGLNHVPLAGDEFEVVSSLDIARERAESRAEYLRNERITEKAGDGKITLSSYASAVSSGEAVGLDLHQLNIIMKVDVQGSIEAIRQALHVLPQDNVTLKFLLQATGDLSNSDVDLAVSSKAIVFGFNVKAPGSVKSYADQKNVEIRLYKVIYELIDDVRNAMEGLLDLVEERVPIGSAEVKAVFSSGSGRVAGCAVTVGKVVKGCGIQVLRRGKEIHVGVLSSLKRVKEIVNEVNAGLECGVGIEDFNEWAAGDIIKTFNTVQKKRTLEEASASISAALEKKGYKSEK